MTICIIFSSQKTRGRVAGNLARLHATHIARPSNQNFDFFQEKHIFYTFLSKIRKISD